MADQVRFVRRRGALTVVIALAAAGPALTFARTSTAQTAATVDLGTPTLMTGSALLPGTLTAQGSCAEPVTVRIDGGPVPSPVGQRVLGDVVLGAPVNGTPKVVGGSVTALAYGVLGWNGQAVLTPTSVEPGFLAGCGYAYNFTYEAELSVAGTADVRLRERGTARIRFAISGGRFPTTGLSVTFTATSHERVGALAIAAQASPAPFVTAENGFVPWFSGPTTVSWTSNLVGPSGLTGPPATTISREGISDISSSQLCDSTGSCAIGRTTIRIDSTPPVLTVTGVVDGANYDTVPTIDCSATDASTIALPPTSGPFQPAWTPGTGNTCGFYVVTVDQVNFQYFASSHDGLNNTASVTGTFTVGAPTPTTSVPTTAPATTMSPTTAPPAPTTTAGIATTTMAPPTTTPTSLVVAVTPNPVAVGVPVTLRLTGAGATGTVNFAVGGVPVGSAAVVNGVAAVTTSVWETGALDVRAELVRWSNGVASVSVVTTQLVVGDVVVTTRPPVVTTTLPIATTTTRPVATTTLPPSGPTLRASATSVGIGLPVTLVMSGLDPADGIVSFSVGATPAGSVVVGRNGVANLDVRAWSAGSATMTATWNRFVGGHLVSVTRSVVVNVG